MKVSRQTIEKIVFSELDGLDPITVTLDDMRLGAGSITIACFGKSWTAFWGGMGERNVADFFTSCDIHYLADRLCTVSATEIDYETISERIGHCVDVTTALTFNDELTEAYGPDWHMDLPTCPNPDYEYLCRIVQAVKDGLTSVFKGQNRAD